MIFSCLLYQIYYDRGETDKTFQTKNPGQNFPNKNHRELRQTPCKDICMYACTTKTGGSEMCAVQHVIEVNCCVSKFQEKFKSTYAKMLFISISDVENRIKCAF